MKNKIQEHQSLMEVLTVRSVTNANRPCYFRRLEAGYRSLRTPGRHAANTQLQGPAKAEYIECYLWIAEP